MVLTPNSRKLLYSFAILPGAVACLVLIISRGHLLMNSKPPEYMESSLEVEVSSSGELVTKEKITLSSLGTMIRSGICFLYPKQAVGLHGPITQSVSIAELTSDRKEVPLYPEERADGLEVCYGQRGTPLAKGFHTLLIGARIAGRVEEGDKEDSLMLSLDPPPSIPLESGTITIRFARIFDKGGVERSLPPEMIRVSGQIVADQSAPSSAESVGEKALIVKKMGRDGTSIEFKTPRALNLNERLVVTLSWPALVYIERKAVTP